MSISRRRFAAGMLGSLAASIPERIRALPASPQLFIFLIAGQFRRIYLDRNTQLQSGGIRRLMQEGKYYPDSRFDASTFTSTGIATLATGAWPQQHGIVADRWFDRRSRSLVQASSQMLEAATLADEVARAGVGRTTCLGFNEKSTSLLAGRAPAQLFWMNESGQFTTRGNPPHWLADYNLQSPISTLHGKRWTAVGAAGDAPPLRTLNYDPGNPSEFIALYKASPFSQDAQFEIMKAILTGEKLGQGTTRDFLFVSLESLELLGYETGSDSPLIDQLVLRLDQQVKAILGFLDRNPGAGKYNVIFTAAHGAPPQPEHRDSQVVPGESIARAVNSALSDWIDNGGPRENYIDKYVYPFLYLKLEALRRQNVAARGARRLAGEIALRQPGVAGFYTADGDCSHTGAWRRRFENSFNALRSGDVMLSYEQGNVEEFGTGRGVSYGSLYNYDASVPLILYGPQFGSGPVERPVQAIDLAPTIARAAGLSIPSSATGEVLADAFAEESPVR